MVSATVAGRVGASAGAWAFAEIERRTPRALHATLKKQWQQRAQTPSPHPVKTSDMLADGWLREVLDGHFSSPVPGGFDASNEELRDRAERQAEGFRRRMMGYMAVVDYLDDARLPLPQGFVAPAGTVVPVHILLQEWDARRFITEQGLLAAAAVGRHYGLGAADIQAVFDQGVYGALLGRIAEQGFPVDEMFAGRLQFMDEAAWRRRQEANMRRMTCSRFWLRWFRKLNRRAAENAVRALGGVSNRRSLYVSNGTYRQFCRHRATQAVLMQMLVFVNELGEEFSLADLHEASVSNPKLRRVELMTRIAGFEWFAQQANHAGVFVTLTCPSRFHAVHYGGRRNDKHDGSTPVDAARYLQGVWAKIRAALGHKKVPIYGFRVAEPHHDGTPHWHLLLFMPADKTDVFRRVVARYACADSRLELGLYYQDTKGEAKAKRRAHFQAARRFAAVRGDDDLRLADFPMRPSHWAAADFWAAADGAVFGQIKKRVDFVDIDWRKGTAAGYIAKYIAKNVDGKNAHDESVGEDWEARTDDPQDLADTVGRVLCWASTHGIRQFQQVGGPPVTVWRELRRLGGAPEDEAFNDALALAVAAADRGDWGRFVSIMGGIDVKRAARPVQLYKEDSDIPTQYGEARPPMIRGVIEQYTGEYKITHAHEWVLKSCGRSAAGGEAAPWTGVNNCTFLPDARPEAAVGKALEQKTAFDAATLREQGRLYFRPVVDFVKASDISADAARKNIIQRLWRSGADERAPSMADIERRRSLIARMRNIRPCLHDDAVHAWIDAGDDAGRVLSRADIERARSDLAAYLAGLITPDDAAAAVAAQEQRNRDDLPQQAYRDYVRHLDGLAAQFAKDAGIGSGIVPAEPVFDHAQNLGRKQTRLPLMSYQTTREVLVGAQKVAADVQDWLGEMSDWAEVWADDVW